MVLFDTHALELFKIPLPWATLQRVADWNEDDGSCVLVYWDREQVVHAKKIPMRELKRVKKWQNQSLNGPADSREDASASVP